MLGRDVVIKGGRTQFRQFVRMSFVNHDEKKVAAHKLKLGI